MDNPVITAETVCKQYSIARHSQFHYHTLRDTLSQSLRTILRGGPAADEQHFMALRDISFSIGRGERVGIIGQNGSGKSTLLKLLSRITLPSSGTLSITGKTASLLEVGTGFHQELSGRENIYLNGSILGMQRQEIRRKFDEIVAFSGVGQFLDTPVKRYSSGMYVRLAFSVAAHLETDILLVDEVLALGDAEFQEKSLGKMEEISKSGSRTVLFVSHNLDAIRVLCSRCILLQSGRMVQDGSPAEVITAYLGRDERRLHASFVQLPARPSIISVSVNPDALSAGRLEIEIEFVSDQLLDPPIPGFVLYNAMNVPVFGSNPRYHGKANLDRVQGRGRIMAVVEQLQMHSGVYKVGVWLGDQHVNYDHKPEALIFDYVNPAGYVLTPDPLLIGSVDINCTWYSQR
jgi:lipopolysaccharide transport system ATP-binding protein